MKILSIFDGISCARVALERAGISVETYYASEVDKYAMQISAKNYPDIIQLGDVSDIDCTGGKLHYGMGCLAETEIDLIVGGSPCQDLSIAKKNRQGLKGERSSLFYEYVRILNEIKPKFFILENVASMPKEAKTIITKELKVEPIMINASLVSAQNRKRLFWTNIPNIIQPKDKGILLKDILEENVDAKYNTGMDFTKRFDHTLHKEPYDKKGQSLRATDYKGTHNMIVFNKNGEEKLKSNTIRTSGKSSGIDDKHNWDTIRIGSIGKGGQGDRIYSTEGKSVNLSANGGGRGAKTGLYRIEKEPHGTALDYYNDTIVPNGKAKVLGTNPQSTTAVAGQLVNDNCVVRKLTPIECERLQGLPDNWTNVTKSSIMEICVNINPVIEKLLPKLDTASCTISVGKDTERQICPLKKNLSVTFAIDGLLPESFATDIIKAGNAMATHYNPNAISQIGTKTQQNHIDDKTGEKSTYKLWKLILAENLPKEKLSIILTSINEIMTSPIFSSVNQEQDIIGYIILSNSQERSYTKGRKYSLMVTNIKSLMSDTQRYKCLGNAFNCDVVAHILKNIK